MKGKPHKRRLHALKTDPYTVEESLKAAGMGSYHKPGTKRKMETMVPEGVKAEDKGEDVWKKAKLEEKEQDQDM